jgi:predicted NBD/HSP70 family sugar kinase
VPRRADPTAVRRANLGVVLGHIAASGPISRARVASDTGLNKSTVSSLVAELAGLRLVREDVDRRVASIGRPATPVMVTGTTVAVGLEVGVDGLTVCLEDLTGALRYAVRKDCDLRDSEPYSTLRQLATLAGDALSYARAHGLRVVGLGVGLPGIVDASRGQLLRAPNLGWQEVDVARELGRLLPLGTLSIAVENEANLAALAELWVGGAQGLKGFIHVTGEVGVGSGIVIDGQLFRGSRGYAGELGHVAVRQDGAACACGSRGCLETVVGIEAIRERAGMPPRPGTGQLAIAIELAQQAAAGDPCTVAALEEAAEALGIALSSAINLIDLEVVFLGGFLTPLAPWLARPVREALARRVLSSAWSTFDVKVSALGAHAAARGAAAVILRVILERPWLVEEMALTDGGGPPRRRQPSATPSGTP